MKNLKLLKTLSVVLVSSFALCESAWADNDCAADEVRGVTTGNCIKKSGDCGSGCTYTLDEKGNLNISGNGSVKGYGVSYDGKKNTWITDAPWKEDAKNLIIGPNIKSIGMQSFTNSNIENITFVANSQLKSIGEFAFERTKLKNIILPSSMEQIDAMAFGGISTLENIVVPDSVTKSAYSRNPTGYNGSSVFLWLIC